MTSFTRFIKQYFLVLVVALTSCIRCQAAETDYVITCYTDEHGLPQNSVKGIGKDNMGFIWLITEKGPVRYDGNGRFRGFDSLVNKLHSARMYSLTSLNGVSPLWAQTYDDEMLLLKDGRATLTKKEYWEVFSKPRMYTPGEIDLVVRLPEIVPKHIPRPLCLPISSKSCFIVSADTVSYFANTKKTASSVHYFPGANPWLFAVHRSKLLYIDRVNTYTEFHHNSQIGSSKIAGDLALLPQDTPFKLYWNTAADQLFIYADNSLYFIDENEQGNISSTKILSDFNFKENQIIAAYYLPEQQQLLLGSDTKGLFVVKKKLFNTITATQRFGRNAYYLQTLLPSGLLLSDEGKTFDPSGTFRFKDQLHHGEAQFNHIVGPSGNLWVLEKDSILIYNANATQLLRKLPNPTSAKVILKSDSANYWLGGDQGIILRYEPKTDRFLPVAQLPQAVSYLETGNQDTLYIGTRKGLYAMHIHTYHWKEIPSFEGKFIRCIYRENEHRLWICTYQHGFSFYELGRTIDFPLDKAGYLSTAHCILEDRKGFFWISTNKGLFQVSKKHLLDYSKDRKHPPFYFYYNKTDGFTTNEFNGGCQPCGILLPDGRFSFPSLDGLVWFDPLTISHKFPVGELILDEVKLNENPFPISDTLRIPHNFSRLDIKIATPFYGNPYNIKIEYMLESEDESPNNWLSINNPDKTLSINKLASGHHKINIRMRTGTGPRDFRHATFHLYIPPLFHETAAFTVLFLAFIGITIWLIIYARTRFILNQNRRLLIKVNERTDALKNQYEWQQRLSTSIAHDIKSPLNYVVKALSNIQEIAKNEDFLPQEMEQIYLSTKNIYHYSNNLTKLAKLTLTKDVLQLTDVCLYQTAQQQIDIFQSVAASRGNALHNHIPQDTIVRSNPDILSVIIHNLLDNATKFTQRGDISIKTEKTIDGSIALSIVDTGVGLHPDQIDYYNHINQKQMRINIEERNIGFGLLLVKDMAQLLGIHMIIRSVLGKGSEISFILPKNPGY